MATGSRTSDGTTTNNRAVKTSFNFGNHDAGTIMVFLWIASGASGAKAVCTSYDGTGNAINLLAFNANGANILNWQDTTAVYTWTEINCGALLDSWHSFVWRKNGGGLARWDYAIDGSVTTGANHSEGISTVSATDGNSQTTFFCRYNGSYSLAMNVKIARFCITADVVSDANIALYNSGTEPTAFCTPIEYWKMDEASGNIVGSQGNNLTVAGTIGAAQGPFASTIAPVHQYLSTMME